MEAKGKITDCSKSSLHGIADREVMELLERSRETGAAARAQTWVDWDQTRKEQGTWPKKTMVCMWFSHEISLIVMIDILKMTREEK